MPIKLSVQNVVHIAWVFAMMNYEDENPFAALWKGSTMQTDLQRTITYLFHWMAHTFAGGELGPVLAPGI